MKISMNWIKDFTDLPDMEASKMGEIFTLKTAEVEGVEEVGVYLSKIFVAEIKSLRKHPEADKLNLVTINYGASETKEIVCGAPNVKVGLKVPYAPIGTTLPGNFTLEPKKIRGILSEGMLCSAKELELGEGSAGLLELDGQAPVGQKLSEYLKRSSDIVLDVDNKSLTHRPDLWGMYGLAREFAAGFETELKNPFNDDWKKNIERNFTNDSSPITPKVETNSSCLAYWGLSINNVKVEESPEWIKERLMAVGLRPINNIVDISNYVMMELGIPLHIFDRDKIKDNTIHIKRADDQDKFVTLDEQERTLIASDTVICDSEKPLVLAGIMGGLNSGVSDDTTKIFIEVANWKAEEVRATSTRLGLRTDSSARYEKSLDSLACYRTLLRTIELVLKLCPNANIVGKPEYDGHKTEINPLKLTLSHEKLVRTLGNDIDQARVQKIFKSLDFKVELQDGVYQVTLPTYRTTKDIECDADLIEEIGRIVGYDNINPVSPLQGIKPIKLDYALDLKRKVQDFLIQNSEATEVLTYPLIGKKLLARVSWPNEAEVLKLINAISVDADRMRPSVIPSALEVVSHNAKNFDSFTFFEYGRSYLANEKNFSTESTDLVIGFYHSKESPFVKSLNVTDRLLNYLGVKFNFSDDHPKFKNPLIDENWMGLHPFEKQNIQIMGQFEGIAFSVHPLLLRNLKIKGNVSFVVIRFDKIEQRKVEPKVKYQPLPKFPGSSFDCTVLVSKDTRNIEPLNIVRKLKIKELTGAKVVTVFPLNNEQDAVTIKSTFEDPEQTLSGDVLEAAQQKIVQSLQDAGFPLKN